VHLRGDGPPLLCVPGGPGRASTYLQDLGGLPRTIHALDSRGSGRSPLPDDRASLAFPRLADDVEDVCAAFDLQPADVLAHSAGCLVALTHAVRYPTRLRRLVLLTPSGRRIGMPNDDVEAIRATRSDEPWYQDAHLAAQLLSDASPDRGRGRRELERATRPFSYGRWDAACQEHAASTDGQMSLRAWAGFDPGPDYDPAPLLAAMRALPVPVLVVVGDRDGLTGAAIGPRLADLLPEGRSVTLNGAGHYPWVDAPDQLRAVVEAFLAEA
jgi:pimeloyl-ACP methyl ester carboxylesterase